MTLGYLENSTVNLVFGLLFITMLIYWTSVAFPLMQHTFKIARVGMIFSCICLSLIISARWILSQYFPLSNLYESLLFLAWCIIFITIILEQKINSRLIGAVTAPLAMLVIAFSTITLPSEMRQVVPLVPALQSNWLMMHVSVMILSYACLITGSLLSVLFLILTYNVNFQLRGSSSGSVTYKKMSQVAGHQLDLANQMNIGTDVSTYTTPSNKNANSNYLNLVESIDNLSYRTIGFGFPLLTLGIIAGAVWANEAWGSYWSWDPKETWALITWLVFAGYLHTRFNKSWEGKKPAILASIGFFVIWICYLGVNFLGKGLHNYGWVL
uniref:Cytochrome c biogenesis protein CcsA n=1 Tax=Hildenbrandia rubra TaxID=31481 RepID=A0A1C9CG02_9FLOR|nr:cytochrome c biogenesis protein [Hildenbrandia rubra]AOM67316.1 cytochrome c biogenesis protein [Hildenbrandia rubra]